MTSKEMMIEQLLERADQAASKGRHGPAITWLYEALRLDRSRRDVARMVRDLQFEVLKRKERWRRIRRMAAPILLGALIGALLELHAQRAYEAIPPVTLGDVLSIEQRLAGLDGLIEDNPLWFGGIRARHERTNLQAELQRLEGQEADSAEADSGEQHEALLSDSARYLARQLVERGDYEGAITQYTLALEEAPPDWQYREQVQTDLEAVRRYAEDGDAVPSGGGR